jgi:hypothetical protein
MKHLQQWRESIIVLVVEIEIETVLTNETRDFRFRVEVHRTRRSFFPRVWRLDAYRMKVSFPSAPKKSSQRQADEFFFVEESGFEHLRATSSKKCLNITVKVLKEKLGIS